MDCSSPSRNEVGGGSSGGGIADLVDGKSNDRSPVGPLKNSDSSSDEEQGKSGPSKSSQNSKHRIAI